MTSKERVAALLGALKGADRGAPPFASRFHEPQGGNPMRNPHDNIRGDPRGGGGAGQGRGHAAGPFPPGMSQDQGMPRDRPTARPLGHGAYGASGGQQNKEKGERQFAVQPGAKRRGHDETRKRNREREGHISRFDQG